MNATEPEARSANRLERYSPWLALSLLVLCGGTAVAVLGEHALGIRKASDFTPASLAVTLVVREAAVLILSLFGVYAILRAPFEEIGLRRPRRRDLLLGIAVGAPALVVIYALEFLMKLPTSADGYYFLFVSRHASGLPAIALFLVIAIFSPIIQEIAFRGIVMEGLLRETNFTIALVVSSAVFACAHLTSGANQTAFAFLTGLVLGWLYWRTRSVAAPSVMHILANTLAMLPVVPHLF